MISILNTHTQNLDSQLIEHHLLTLQFKEQKGARSRIWGNCTCLFTLQTLYPTYRRTNDRTRV